ncbi:site-specific integrase [Mesorhizobium sp. B2-7-3]|uniref:tyrosine-type recombinase/integrase n=1 Tax=Mesorhizobium sp. B2-7-3 TaxID=2589907 RepID=UPI00112A9B87|nr:site-specific integrase [Mesorhizobium sp. B2-7-3]TPJ13733.1 site-specific integrase [Mesorhizobium sp. B2-7-3]
MAKRVGVALTKRVVDFADKRDRRYFIWDSELSGFGLRVEMSGAKTFVVRYRAEGGGRTAAQRFVTIGRLGTLTPEQARKQAKIVLGGVAKGEDPADERRARRREMKTSALIDLYEEEGCVIQRGKRQGQPMKPLTKQLTLARLRNHVVPLLGHKRVSELNAGDIERFVRDITAGKTNRDEKIGPRKRIIVRGGEGAARKVVRDLSAVFSFAIRSEIVQRNPCETAAVRKTDNQRKRFLALDEVALLGSALDALEAEGVNSKAVNIARLWALTGCRREEIASLKWTEVNLGEGLLELDDSKTGKSIRPLGAAAVTLLESLPREAGSAFVFPAERGDSYFQGTKRIWAKAIKKAKLPGVTPHTLRHTIGSTAISTGEALALTGAILGHSNPRSTAIYAHVQNDPSRRAASRVAKKIAAALAGNNQTSRRPPRKSAGPEGLTDLDRLTQLFSARLLAEGIDASQVERILTDVFAVRDTSAKAIRRIL